jgi:thiamine biosynthesis protein ThiI
MADTVVIHPGELFLKGANRPFFERQLIENACRRLGGLPFFYPERQTGSFLLRFKSPLTAEDEAAVRGRLKTVFGIAGFAFADSCPKELPEITRLAVARMADTPPGTTFKVESRRSDKSFPLTSLEISREVGATILKSVPGLKVDVSDPRRRVLIQINERDAFVSAGFEPGAGGLPVGTSGKVAALLSGGIDSPVAAWKLMRRGCPVVLIHFHSYPYVGRASLDKVKRLAAILAGWQGDSTLYFVPFGDIQREIATKAREDYRVVLYRRSMLRLAEALARCEGALGLVTGDSVGQVASQTVENLAAVSAAAGMPIYRPLIGDDKQEISDLARRIGTYDISIEPHDDCCSLFVPPHPATKATASQAEREEASLSLDDLMKTALEKTERITVQTKEAV